MTKKILTKKIQSEKIIKKLDIKFLEDFKCLIGY